MIVLSAYNGFGYSCLVLVHTLCNAVTFFLVWLAERLSFILILVESVSVLTSFFSRLPLWLL